MNSKISKLIKPSWLILMFVAFLGSPGLAAVFDFAPQEPDCLHEYHWLEAECGDVFAPGQLGQDPEASEGGYLTTPAGSGRFIEHVAGPLIAAYNYTLLPFPCLARVAVASRPFRRL